MSTGPTLTTKTDALRMARESLSALNFWNAQGKFSALPMQAIADMKAANRKAVEAIAAINEALADVCQTCDGIGRIDQTLGGHPLSSWVDCPDCKPELDPDRLREDRDERRRIEKEYPNVSDE